MKKVKRKRVQKSIYISDDEYELIRLFSKRICTTPAKAIRKAALAMAANPDLDYLFDEGVLLKVAPEIIKRRLLIINKTDKILAMLERQELVRNALQKMRI